MTELQVFLSGEGANELGSLAREPEYQSHGPFPGVIEAILRRVKESGWQVVGAKQWHLLHNFRALGGRTAEERAVLALAFHCDDAGADVLAFVRDDDDEDRGAEIQAGIAKAQEQYPHMRIIGGTAIPKIEGWILAMLGEFRTEKLSVKTAYEKLKAMKGIDKDTDKMVAIVRGADLKSVPDDAQTLRAWVGLAGEVLGA